MISRSQPQCYLGKYCAGDVGDPNAADGCGNTLSTRERTGKGTGLDITNMYVLALPQTCLVTLGKMCYRPGRFLFCEMGEMNFVTKNSSI